MTALKQEEVYQDEILNNITDTILDKLSIMKVSLNKLAKDADIDYYTLRNIINKKTLPNTKVICEIAAYLNITPSELISRNSLPQTIPIIDKREVDDFITNKDSHKFEKYPTIRLENRVHPNAFAVTDAYLSEVAPAKLIYICFHGSPNTSLEENQVYLVNYESDIIFIRIIRILSENVKFISRTGTISGKLHQIKYIATVVGMKMLEALI